MCMGWGDRWRQPMAVQPSCNARLSPLPPVADVAGVQEGEGEQQRHHHVPAGLLLAQHAAGAHHAAVQVAACSRTKPGGWAGKWAARRLLDVWELGAGGSSRRWTRASI